MADIRDLTEADLPGLTATKGGPAWRGGGHPIWRQYLEERQAGVRDLLVAHEAGAAVGYVTLLWRSHYPPFAETRIPEISDMVVAEDWRRRGIGEALIGVCETRAAVAGYRTMGIGVGLYADYGSAQRLYVRLGYKPDGRGVYYADAPATPGQTYRLDDDLVLFLTKPLP
jgi:GNAT superfamily N-acetyltransferase